MDRVVDGKVRTVAVSIAMEESCVRVAVVGGSVAAIVNWGATVLVSSNSDVFKPAASCQSPMACINSDLVEERYA